MTAKFKGPSPDLSKQERKVIALRAMGFDRQETAKRLHVTRATVAKHQSSIHQKTNTGNMIEAILRYLFARGRI